MPAPSLSMLRVAGRELRIVGRSRGAGTSLLLLAALAWLPPLLLPLRAGAFGVADFSELLPLVIAAEGVVLPLLALLFGAEGLAGEVEDGSLLSLVTLPVSRGSCFLGKLAGRVVALLAAELVLFGSAAVALTAVHGAQGLGGYVLVQVSALLLSIACVAIGAALAAGGGGRVRVYAVTLLSWVVLVFLVDAVLLAAIVVLTPAAPDQIGEHGHSELSQAMPMRQAGGDGTSRQPSLSRTGAWLLSLDPVDLFRLASMPAVEPAGVASRAAAGTRASRGPAARPSVASLPLVVGWLAWLTLPTLIGVWRFRRLPLR